MTIIAIDPGNKTSGWVVLEGRKVLAGASATPNETLFSQLATFRHVAETVACEWIQSYGMTVGKEVFHTCRWVGRFEETVNQWPDSAKFRLVYRRDVKLHLCQSTRAKDKNVRQAILDSYPATGGGVNPVIGTKKLPGPLYGVSGHMWAALALGLTVLEAETIAEVN